VPCCALPERGPDPRQWPADHLAEWTAWAERYTARLAKEARPAAERRAEMELANPKYILRNWMAAEAYEAAERGDFGPVREVHKLLCNPYEEQVTSRRPRASLRCRTHPPTHHSAHPEPTIRSSPPNRPPTDPSPPRRSPPTHPRPPMRPPL